MINAGDEIGRTQKGNNNAYCQDNETSWFNWDLGEPEQKLLQFVQKLIKLRRESRVLRRSHFLRSSEGGEGDMLWLHPDGHEMRNEEWRDDMSSFGMLIERMHPGERIGLYTIGEREEIVEPLLILFARHPAVFIIPDRGGVSWYRIMDTALNAPASFAAGQEIQLPERSISIFRTDRRGP
jgi:isoamylase